MEKYLIKVDKKNIFYKIKNIFVNLFKKKHIENGIEERREKRSEEKHESMLRQDIKGVGGKKLNLLDLQKKYKAGEIKEEEMAEEEIEELCKLYDVQNEQLRKSNEYRRQKLAEYRNSKKVS